MSLDLDAFEEWVSSNMELPIDSLDFYDRQPTADDWLMVDRGKLKEIVGELRAGRALAEAAHRIALVTFADGHLTVPGEQFRVALAGYDSNRAGGF